MKTSLLGFQCDCFCSQWTSGWGSPEGKVALWAREVIINTFLLRPSYRASVQSFDQKLRTSHGVSVHLHLMQNMPSLPFSQQLASPSHSISCRGAGRLLCCLWGMTWDRQAGVIRKAQAQTWAGRKKISLTAHKQDITVWHFCTENIISTNGISGALWVEDTNKLLTKSPDTNCFVYCICTTIVYQLFVCSTIKGMGCGVISENKALHVEHSNTLY